MVDYGLLSFSFLQGIIAFFAPCAVALLPGYISRFATQGKEGKALIARALKISTLMILGFLTIYGIAGALLAVASQLVKSYMPYIVIGMSVLIIILGTLMALGKNIALSIHLRTKHTANETIEAYLFGIAYGLGALGCLFPLFLVVATSALAAQTLTEGALYLLAYFIGMSIFTIIFAFLAVFSQQFLQKRMRTILPYITRASGILLIIAGTYIIMYQRALF